MAAALSTYGRKPKHAGCGCGVARKEDICRKESIAGREQAGGSGRRQVRKKGCIAKCIFCAGRDQEVPPNYPASKRELVRGRVPTLGDPGRPPQAATRIDKSRHNSARIESLYRLVGLTPKGQPHKSACLACMKYKMFHCACGQCDFTSHM